MEFNPDSWELRVIGRYEDQEKLSTGVFVSPSAVEVVYDECKSVDRIFVYVTAMHRVCWR